MTTSCDIPEQLIAAIRGARHVCLLTGAGVSAESGVPTFREAQDGLWARYRAEDLATPDCRIDSAAACVAGVERCPAFNQRCGHRCSEQSSVFEQRIRAWQL